ncbi:MAG: cysteine hydrolase [Candidatus Dormiibacterota bacterium]|jgi:nicotinamidase-related amidase
MTSSATIAADKTAVVLLEPQNDFLSPGGTLYAFIKDETLRKGVVDNLAALLAGARERGVKVIYVPFRPLERGGVGTRLSGTGHSAQGATLMLSRIEQIRERHQIAYRDEGAVCLECGHYWPCDTAVALEEIGALRQRNAVLDTDGLDGPEVVPQLRPRTGDLIIEGNKTLDAFHSTALNHLLHANGIEYLAFAGFHTNWCVESTARSAYDEGYHVIVVSDCTGADTEEEQQHALRFIFPKIGQVMTAAEFLAVVESPIGVPSGMSFLS